jgi:hypothetical protein
VALRSGLRGFERYRLISPEWSKAHKRDELS